jgi:Fic family protein
MKEKFYKIVSPVRLELDDLVRYIEQFRKLQPEIQKANADYLHWEELRYKSWIPEHIVSKPVFWGLLRISRQLKAKPTPIQDKSGAYYTYCPDQYTEFLHQIDKEMGGHFMGITDFSSINQQHFITRNLIEEAIASSQLEGANTARSAAKKMLVEGRKPNNFSERMIVNNHQTMKKIEQEIYKQPLSLELLYELHRMITRDTLEEEKQGKLRDTYDGDGNELIITPWDDRTATYIAPSKDFVEKEILRLIDFANDMESSKHDFVHPLIRGIMLHFWLALLHPFEDGNGRLARVLFYWYMLKHEYWAFAYLSLSERILKSPKQYAMAYVYSEQDDFDLTYFIHYNIGKLILAQKDFKIYVARKINENREMVSVVQCGHEFNERQIHLLQHLNHKKDRRTSIPIYQDLNKISRLTAYKDLKQLLEKDLLQERKQGRIKYYYPTKAIEDLFRFL